MPTSKEIAVLVTCQRVIRTWPVEARIAFREAVLRDVTQFVPGEWDLGAALVAAERFGDRWVRGLPWPPSPDERRQEPPAATFDRERVDRLARRIRALGLELAITTR